MLLLELVRAQEMASHQVRHTSRASVQRRVRERERKFRLVEGDFSGHVPVQAQVSQQ